MIEVPAVIDKKDIAVLGALKGTTNDVPVSLNGTSWKRGEVVFLGFVGAAKLVDRRYHGVVRFTTDNASVIPSGDFSPILRAMEINESEVDDEQDGNDH